MNVIDLIDQIARKVVPPSSGFAGKLELLYRRAQGKYEAITENGDAPEWKKNLKFKVLENEFLIYFLIFSFNRISNFLITWGTEQPKTKNIEDLDDFENNENFN